MVPTDEEIFDSAIAETPPTPEPVQEAAPTPEPTQEGETQEQADERARDEKGRFVAKEPEQQSEPDKGKEGWVPSHRLREEREKAEARAEAKYQELQSEIREMRQAMYQRQQPQQAAPVPEPVDIFADPDGFVKSFQKSNEEREKNRDLQISLRFARLAHGEKFDKAYEAFVDHAHRTRDQAAYLTVMQSADPGEALVNWHREQEMRQELGGMDLKSFLEKQKEAWLNDPANQSKAIELARNAQSSAPPANPVNLPPSLSRASSAGSPHMNMGDGTQQGIWDSVKPQR